VDENRGLYKKDSAEKTVNGFLSSHASVLLNEFEIDETIEKFNLEI